MTKKGSELVYCRHLTSDKDLDIKWDYCNYQTAKTQTGDILIEILWSDRDGRGVDERRDIGC